MELATRHLVVTVVCNKWAVETLSKMIDSKASDSKVTHVLRPEEWMTFQSVIVLGIWVMEAASFLTCFSPPAKLPALHHWHAHGFGNYRIPHSFINHPWPSTSGHLYLNSISIVFKKHTHPLFCSWKMITW